MKFIITGHLGQIGRELKKKLENLGNECVLSIDKRQGVNTSFLNNINEQADILFHLAANCKINKTIGKPALAFENSKSIEDTLEFCRRNQVKKFVFFSSSRILNKEKNPYTASKVYGEELCKTYHQCYGIDYIIIRPSTVYGGIDDTENKRLFQIWMDNAKQGKDLEIYGDKNKTLSFTYIDDFVGGVIDLTNGKWNREYNIVGKEEYLVDVAKEIIKQANSKSKVKFAPPEIAQPQKVSIESDYPCNIDIREGIKKCLEKKK